MPVHTTSTALQVSAAEAQIQYPDRWFMDMADGNKTCRYERMPRKLVRALPATSGG